MTPLRICLVSMPWLAIDSPSLSIGILRSLCRGQGRELPATYFGNLRWAEYLIARSKGDITLADCLYINEESISHNLGEFVFSGVLNNDPSFGSATLHDYLASTGANPGKAWQMREYAADFIEQSAREVLSTNPDLVGFSTTFQQNAASLALAARIKQLHPNVITVFGGGNCDGPMGAAIHRNFSAVDYIVRGEGENAFPMLLNALENAEPVDNIFGLCWRGPDGSVANPEAVSIVPPSRIPMPDYDDWFAVFNASPLRSTLQPMLVLESARGCWWGAAHQCTFCGLNGSFIQFRSKSPDRVIAEITHMVERHQVLDIGMVDNIIDNTFYQSVLPRLAELDWDLRIYYEVKSNLKQEHISALRAGHVLGIQPGIESLSSRVLKLMDKGVSGWRNVRALRDCESACLTVSWNWLIGFPGEVDEDYWPVIRQLSALVHLQPPDSGPTRIFLERFSPNFDRPELGFTKRTPKRSYWHVYDLPEAELEQLVYLFDCDAAGIDGSVVDALDDGLETWRKGYGNSSLTRTVTPDGIEIRDRRDGWAKGDHHIIDPDLIAAYLELEHGRSLPALLLALKEAGHATSEERIGAWLEHLVDQGLVFVDGSCHLALASADIPVRKIT